VAVGVICVCGLVQTAYSDVLPAGMRSSKGTASDDITPGDMAAVGAASA
jgi:hypothetical protein